MRVGSAAQFFWPLSWLMLAAAPAWAADPPGPGPAKVGHTVVSLSVTPLRERFDTNQELVRLGEKLFNDQRLSSPAGTSCASCHDPAAAYAGNNGSHIGVSKGSRPGHFAARNAPSLMYTRYTPALYFYQDDDSNAPEPRGGLFTDGRSDSIQQAIALPLLNPDEMNNRDPQQLAGRLLGAGYQSSLTPLFGERVLSDPAQTMAAVGAALQAFLQSDRMAPFSSRFDDYLRGKDTLNAQEKRGLQLFKDPDKGNCASCHVFTPSSTNGARSLFTDYGYDAIAAPRNRRIPANRDPSRFDVGLCTIAQQKQWPEPESWCGYFKTPTLRNVAARNRWMHNGVFDNLRDVVAFYATRATDPGRWYKTGVKFDDVPKAARSNINVNSTPYNRREGTTPALDDADIDAIVAFLGTLTDASVRVGGPAVAHPSRLRVTR